MRSRLIALGLLAVAGCQMMPKSGVVATAFNEGGVVNYAIVSVDPFQHSVCIDGNYHVIGPPLDIIARGNIVCGEGLMAAFTVTEDTVETTCVPIPPE